MLSSTTQSTFRSLIALAIVALVAASLVIAWDCYALHASASAPQLAGQPTPSDSTLRPPAPNYSAQPTLHGQAAIAHLKQQGLYDSLVDAKQAPLMSDTSAIYQGTIIGPTQTELANLTASDMGLGKEFGNAVAISESTAVVGSRLDTEKGSNAGAAYIFRLSGGRWVQTQKLTTNAGDLFGSSVAINETGTTIAVGAPGDNSKGSAYIFDSSGSLIKKLSAPPDVTPCAEFGGSVAISGGLIVVGARFTHDACPGFNACDPRADLRDLCVSGSAYIFDSSGGFIQKLNGSPGNAFGGSVAISGSIIVVGGAGDAGLTGAAYVFRCPGPCPAGSWFQQQKLMAPDKAPGDQFGQSVAISGSTIVVGAVLADIGGTTDQGAAYAFRCSAPCSPTSGPSWFPDLPKLTASDGAANDHFGGSVAIGGGKVVVGTPDDDSNEGSAYLFEFIGGSWSQTKKLIPCSKAVNDLFGTSVGISGDRVLVGAPGDHRLNPDNKLTTAGSAYIFETDDIVCLTDNRTGDVLRVNLTTGAYKYTRCHSSLDFFAPPGDRFGCVFNVGNPFPFGFNCDQMMGTFRISSECGVHCCTYTLTEHTPFGKPIVIATINRCSFFPNTVTVTGDAKTMFSPRFGVGFTIRDTKDESTCCCR